MIRSKKGMNPDDIAFVIIGLILVLLLFISLEFVKHSTFEVTAEKQRVNDDLFLVTLLRTDTDNGRIQDILIEAYSQDDYSKLQSAVSKALDDAFEEKVCWRLLINEKSVERRSGCVDPDDLNIGDVDGMFTINYKLAEEKATIPPNDSEIPQQNLVFTHGELLNTHPTWYYSPTYPFYLIGNAKWCFHPEEPSAFSGTCLSSTDLIRQHYNEVGYPLSYYNYNIDNCLGMHHGWCCIMNSERGFYEEVKCEGTGYIEYEDHFEKTTYLTIGWSEETSSKTGYFEKGEFVTEPKFTLACPMEFDKGTKFFVDFGSGNPYTGCYECNDRGAGIRIESGVIDLDLYAGISEAAYTHALDTTGHKSPDVYMGCSAREAEIEDDDDDEPTIIPRTYESTVEGIEHIEIRLIL